VASTWSSRKARAKVIRNFFPGTLSNERMLAQRPRARNRTAAANLELERLCQEDVPETLGYPS
jgi:hypothetical protein